jgi:hypothetical protein
MLAAEEQMSDGPPQTAALGWDYRQTLAETD